MIRFDNHAFKGLDAALQRLFDLLHQMGGQVDALIALLPEGLEHANADTFATAKTIDKTINAAEQEADAMVAAMINKFTIMGEDLRFVLGSIKIAGTLERAADKVKNCIKRLSRVHHPIDAAVKAELAKAVASTRAMLPLALAQIADYHPAKVQELLGHGAVVQKSYRTILLQLHAHTSPADDETHILLMAKNLEQTADMAVEIMKICHFVHMGTKYEKSADKVAG